jgi:hypothetical protein
MAGRTGNPKEPYPKIVMQFIRQGPTDSNYGFELVTWWQMHSMDVVYKVMIETSAPTVKQIELIHAKGSAIIINKYTKDL